MARTPGCAGNEELECCWWRRCCLYSVCCAIVPSATLAGKGQQALGAWQTAWCRVRGSGDAGGGGGQSLYACSRPDFEHIVWGTGARAALDFGISDEDALSRPFVEWAAWLLEALLTVDAQRNEGFVQVGAAGRMRNQQLCCVDATAFATLVQAAFAGNMALKHFAFRILARVLCVVRERLLILAMHRLKLPQRAEAAGKHAGPVSGSAMFMALEGSSACSAALEYLSSLQEHLLVNLFTNRHRKEKSTRVTYSFICPFCFARVEPSAARGCAG